MPIRRTGAGRASSGSPRPPSSSRSRSGGRGGIRRQGRASSGSSGRDRQRPVSGPFTPETTARAPVIPEPEGPGIQRTFVPSIELPNLRQAVEPLFHSREFFEDRGTFVGPRDEFNERRFEFPGGRLSRGSAALRGATRTLGNLLDLPSALAEQTIGGVSQTRGRPFLASLSSPGAGVVERAARRGDTDVVQTAARQQTNFNQLIRTGLSDFLTRAATEKDPLIGGEGRGGRSFGHIVAGAVVAPDFTRPGQAGDEARVEREARVEQSAANINSVVLNMAARLDEIDPGERVPPTAYMLASVAQEEREEGNIAVAENVQESLGVLLGSDEKAEELVGIAEEYKALSQGLTFKDAFTPEVFEAARFTYENPALVIEARQRLEAGEDFDEVLNELDERVTAQERGRDFVFRMVLDPLNVLDVVAPGRILSKIPVIKDVPILKNVLRGVQGRTDDFARAARVERVLEATRPADEIIDALRATGDIPRGPLAIPRTLDARSRALGEEAASVVGDIARPLTPDNEGMQLLAKAGIHDAPEVVALKAIIDPTLAEYAGKTEMVADELLEALGLHRYVDEAGEVVNVLHSPAAIRQRHLLQNLDVGRAARQLDEANVGLEKVLSNFRGDKPPRGSLAQVFKEDLARRGEALSELVRGRPGAAMAALRSPAARAADEANEAVADALQLIQKTQEATLGVQRTTNILTDTRKRLGQIQSVFSTLFHMGLNPGWMIRNVMTDTMIKLADGIGFVGVRESSDFMLRLGVSPVDAFREFGGRLDRRAFEKLSANTLFRTQARLEQASSLQSFVTGYQRAFPKVWAQAIDETALSGLPQEKARLVSALLSGAHSGDDIQLISKAVREGEGWRLILGEGLRDRAFQTGIIHDVDEILSSAKDLDDAIDQLRAIGPELREIAYKNRLNLAAPNSLEAAVGDVDYSIANLIGFDEDGAQFYQRNKKAIIDQMGSAVDSGHAYAQDMKTALIRQIEMLNDPAEQARLYRQVTEFDQSINNALFEYQRLRHNDLQPDVVQQMYVAVDTGTWRTHPEFRFVVSNNGAWQRFYRRKNEIFLDLSKDWFDRFVSIGEDIREAAKIPPRATPVWESLNRTFYADQARLRRQFNRGQILNNIAGRYDSNRYRGAFQLFSDVIEEAPRFGDTGAELASELIQLKNTGQIRKWVNSDSLTDDYAEIIIQVGASRTGIETPLRSDQLAEAIARIDVSDAIPSIDPALGKNAVAAQVDNLVEDIIEDIATRFDLQEGLVFTPDELRIVDDVVKAHVPRMNEAQTIASRVGVGFRDFALHNYSDRTVVDQFLSMGFNYPFWYTRNMKNWALRLLETPGRVAALIKWRNYIRESNRAKGLPEWYQDQVSLKTAMGELYFPILALLDPLNGIFGDRFFDRDYLNTPVGAAIADASQFGPGPHAVISIAMALDAQRRGEEQEADKWMGYLGSSTKGLRAATVVARQVGMQDIPPGGLGVEWWLYQDPFFGGRFEGSPWDVRRIGKALYDLVDSGEITWEEMNDAGYYQTGEAYDLALEKASESTALFTLASWLGGAGLRGRSAAEIEIAQFDQAVANFYDYQRENPGALTPEQERLWWQDIRNQYPFMDAVMYFRRDEDRRLEMLSWSVINRLPPNSAPFTEAFFGEDRSDLVYEFYQNKTRNMNERELQEWRIFVEDMNAVLALPPTATSAEWDAAIGAKIRLNDFLENKYPEAIQLQSEFFGLETNEEKRAFLEANPQLELYWSENDQLIQDTPLLFKYYGTMDIIEDNLQEERDAEIRRRWPENEELWREYRALKAINGDAASDFFGDHPSLGEELDFKSEYDLLLRSRLEELSEGIGRLSELLPGMREGIPEEELTLGGLTVAQLIEDQALSNYELPENLSDRELVAALNQELDAVPSSEWRSMRRALDDMGNMDRVLDAFTEFRNTETAAIPQNRLELQALLVALETIREEAEWELNPAVAEEIGAQVEMARGEDLRPLGDFTLAATGGTGGRRRRRRRRGHRGGGGGGFRSRRGGARFTRQQVEQASAQVQAFLTDLRRNQPGYWAQLRTLVDMAEADREAYLSQHSAFAEWLASIGIPLSAIVAYYNLRNRPAPTSSGSSFSSSRGRRATRARFSNPNL